MRVRRPGMKWDWQHGLAGLRDDAPSHTPATQRRRRGGRRRDRRARAGFEIDHSEPQARVWRSRGRDAAHRHTQRPGPTAPGTPAKPQIKHQHSTGARARRPAPLDATTQTRTLRSTCVRSRSARAARRSRRSSRSPRLRRRAGPHRLSRACRRPWCRCARHPRPRPRRPRTRP